jgi:G3E family GTPase
MDMIIIAGFLGSGKTTLILNTIGKITELTGKKVAMIVNDFGNIGIDGKVMEKYGLKVQELPRGCICCTLGPSFLDTVRTIHDKFDPDLVVVEPSGIADPDPIHEDPHVQAASRRGHGPADQDRRGRREPPEGHGGVREG